MSTHLDTRSTRGDTVRRQVRVTPLVVGLVFLGIAGFWLSGELGWVDVIDDPWVVPAVLVAAGAIGLVVSALGMRQASRPLPDADWHDEREPFLLDDPADDTEAGDGEETAPLR